MSAWPSTLPSPLANGYSIKPVDQSIRTNMEVGAARVRRRTFSRNDKVPVSWLLTDDQMAIFRAWFENGSTGASGGASWFSTSLSMGTGGMSAVTARFVGPFTANRLDRSNWAVSGELEIR
jgi:hypothetical protein